MLTEPNQSFWHSVWHFDPVNVLANKAACNGSVSSGFFAVKNFSDRQFDPELVLQAFCVGGCKLNEVGLSNALAIVKEQALDKLAHGCVFTALDGAQVLVRAKIVTLLADTPV